MKCAAFAISCECSKIWTTICLLHFNGSFHDAYFSEGMLLRDHGDVASPYLQLSPGICWNSGASAVRVPYYKNRGKQGSQYSFLVTMRTHLSCLLPHPQHLILKAWTMAAEKHPREETMVWYLDMICPFKSVWSEGLEFMLPPIYMALYPLWRAILKP